MDHLNKKTTQSQTTKTSLDRQHDSAKRIIGSDTSNDMQQTHNDSKLYERSDARSRREKMDVSKMVQYVLRYTTIPTDRINPTKSIKIRGKMV